MNKATLVFLQKLIHIDQNTTYDGRFDVDYLQELLSSRQDDLAIHINNKDKFVERLTKDYEFYVEECHNLFQQISELKHFRYALIKELGEDCLPNKIKVLNDHINQLEVRLTRYKKEVDVFEQPGYIEEKYQSELRCIKDGIDYVITHQIQQTLVEQEVYLIKRILRRNYAEEFDK